MDLLSGVRVVRVENDCVFFLTNAAIVPPKKQNATVSYHCLLLNINILKNVTFALVGAIAAGGESCRYGKTGPLLLRGLCLWAPAFAGALFL